VILLQRFLLIILPILTLHNLLLDFNQLLADND